MSRPRLCVLSEALARSHDEGIKNLARAFVREARDRCEVLGLSSREAIPEWNTEYFSTNKLFFSPTLWRRIRRFRPDVLLYVAWTSASLGSVARAWFLRQACRVPVALVATQPMPYGPLERFLVSVLRPSMTFVQGPDNDDRLRRLGHRVAFLPSGVDLSAFGPIAAETRLRARRALGLPEDSWVISHVGHLNRRRIDEDLFRSLQALPGVQVVVVGSIDQPQDNALVDALEAAGVVVIRRYLERVAEVYEASDAYLFPVRSTVNAIGVPLSVLEAMACNLPVITTPFEGLVQMFPEAKDGLHYARDGREIIATINELTNGASDTVATRQLVDAFSWTTVVHGALDRMTLNMDGTADRRDFLRQVRKWGVPGWSHRESYEGFHVASVVHRARLRKLLQLLESLPLDEKGAIADFGCSDGFILYILYDRLFRDKQWQFYGFDIESQLIDLASRSGIPNSHFKRFDLNQENSSSGVPFDLVLLLETVEHTGNYKNAVLNVVRSCAVGGYILVSAPDEMAWRGLVKFFGRKVLQRDPYGDFFAGKSRWKYLKEMIRNGDIEQFRNPPRDGWGPHLGFNILQFERFLSTSLFEPGEYRLVLKRTSFLGFNRLYLIQRIR